MDNIKSAVREQHYNYLLGCKKAGGEAAGFRDFIEAWRQKTVARAIIDGSESELLAALSDKVWRDESNKPADPKQRSLCLDGKPCPTYMTFKDFKQNRFRRILSEYATVAHLRDHWEIHQAKANEAIAASSSLHDLYVAALEKSGNNPDAMLIHLADAAPRAVG